MSRAAGPPAKVIDNHNKMNESIAHSATAERSFSALKRVKTRIRSSMLQGRLKALLLMAVERDILLSI